MKEKEQILELDLDKSLVGSFLKTTLANKAKLDGGEPTIFPFKYPSLYNSIRGLEPGAISAVLSTVGQGNICITH